MTEDERDRMIIETHTNVSWLMCQHKQHIAEHAKYAYMMIAAMFTAFVGLFR